MSDETRTGRVGHPRPRIGVPSCPHGEPVRHDDAQRHSEYFTDMLDQFVRWVPVCPEEELGLGVQRETLRSRRVDHTEVGPGLGHAQQGRSGLPDVELFALDGYMLRNTSSSCGYCGQSVCVHRSGVSDPRRDSFVQRLSEISALPTEEERRLSDPEARDHFVERVFAHARLREMFELPWRPRDLVSFHARHKLQLMAHEPQSYRELGRLTARSGTDERGELGQKYRALFQRALALHPTASRHVNALHHAFGMVSDHLDDSRRHDVLAAVDSYQAGTVPLTVPVSLIRHYCVAEGVRWVAEQTYLEPFPPELGLRGSVVKR